MTLTLILSEVTQDSQEDHLPSKLLEGLESQPQFSIPSGRPTREFEKSNRLTPIIEEMFLSLSSFSLFLFYLFVDRNLKQVIQV